MQREERQMAELIPVAQTDDSPWGELLRCSETQLYHWYEPEQGIFIAESPNVIERALHAGYVPELVLADRAVLTPAVLRLFDACDAALPVYTAETAVMEQIAGYHLTRGLLCAMRRRAMPAPEMLTAGNARRVAVLENVMNPTNLGAIFRSAAALGVDAVLLTGGCTDPLYRRAARVSMGTVFQVPWTYLPDAPDASEAVQLLRSAGWCCAAMALSERAVSVAEPRLHEAARLAVVLGTEGTGLTDRTLAACDEIVMIPMSHGVDSLNVAAASAVAFWELRART